MWTSALDTADYSSEIPDLLSSSETFNTTNPVLQAHLCVCRYARRLEKADDMHAATPTHCPFIEDHSVEDQLRRLLVHAVP